MAKQNEMWQGIDADSQRGHGVGAALSDRSLGEQKSRGAEGLGSSLGDLDTSGVAGISSSGDDGELGKDFSEGDGLTIIEDDYEIEGKELAHGGMGVVHRARQRRLNRPVAIKFIKPELSKNPIVRKRFVSESR